MPTRPKLKVKTGCTTCRRRKLKCDEEKPTCNRCKTSRRECGGYPLARSTTTSSPLLPSKWRVNQISVKPQSHPFFPDLVFNTAHLSPFSTWGREESRWLQFFIARTGPALTPFFEDRAFWLQDVPLLGLEEPAIRHALFAVASLHAQFELAHDTADSPQISGYGNYTIRQYNLALCALQQAIDNRRGSLEVALISCLLFVVLECLYGNYPLVLANLEHGLNILKLPCFQSSRQSERSSMRKRIKQTFAKLLAHSTLFGAEAITFESSAPNDDEPVDWTLNQPFYDLNDAKSCLDTLTSSSLHFVKSLHDERGELKQVDIIDHQQSQQKLRNQLTAWEHRLQASESMTTQSISPDDLSVTLLQIEHQSLSTYLAQCDFEESPFDKCRPEFIRILDLCRTFFEKNPKETSPTTTILSKTFSLYSSCVPALFLTAFKCRDPILRREAIAMLETCPRREGLWDAALHAKIGRRVIEYEEAKMLCFEGAESAAMEEAPSMRMIASNGAVLSDWPLERFRVRNIARTIADPSRSARVTFYIAPDGPDAQLVTWNEDFVL